MNNKPFLQKKYDAIRYARQDADIFLPSLKVIYQHLTTRIDYYNSVDGILKLKDEDKLRDTAKAHQLIIAELAKCQAFVYDTLKQHNAEDINLILGD